MTFIVSWFEASTMLVINYQHGRFRRDLAMTNWEHCPEVERHPDKLSGAWVFLGTRVPVTALFENLEDGATVEQFLEWFPGVDQRNVEAVLAHEGVSSLGAPAGS